MHHSSVSWEPHPPLFLQVSVNSFFHSLYLYTAIFMAQNGSLLSRTANTTTTVCFVDIGAAYGTAKSGVGISSMGVMNV